MNAVKQADKKNAEAALERLITSNGMGGDPTLSNVLYFMSASSRTDADRIAFKDSLLETGYATDALDPSDADIGNECRESLRRLFRAAGREVEE
ncbi:MAG: hypothetical protein QF858_03165 [Candidatus Pacebacteria bacterium]|jgi:hypothetical protein|nr:hypothetical protein [bacterium]MDP6527850.1 hypothetical protein [Candidatus Paceibacterota bacterium]MDP6659795.1 hypothetical protein [Candidatus Paceibacterota bacterium]|tara:strand:- start:13017 stop:13298 length:282 start_codon:yes stop_codon:yes gene_type:complete